MSEHSHTHGPTHGQSPEPDYFERPGWEERYAGEGTVWSGKPNPQLVAEVSAFAPGTALDVGCGEGGDVVWLAQQGWTVTGADFAANGLARTLQNAASAGVADQVDIWQVDARTFEAGDRAFDLVTCHFLHPSAQEGEQGMAGVTARLSTAVAPGGHLLVVGHAPTSEFGQHDARRTAAMFTAAELLPALGPEFEVVVCEQRPRTMTREGVTFEAHDSTLLARRVR